MEEGKFSKMTQAVYLKMIYWKKNLISSLVGDFGKSTNGSLQIRDQYYSDLIDQIVARKRANTLITYEDVLDIINQAQPASYSALADNKAIEQPGVISCRTSPAQTLKNYLPS